VTSPDDDQSTEQSALAGSARHTIDMELLLDLERLGGRDFVFGLVAQFSTDAAELLSRLRAAVAKQDVHRFRNAAHALRGSAANLGASTVFQRCLDLRVITRAQLALEGDTEIDQLAKEIDESLKALNTYVVAPPNYP
jgi:two-component system sensor histidine kinase RpfC